MKSVVRTAKAQGVKVISRVIPQDVGESWQKKVEGLEEEVEEVLKEEKEERLLQSQEMMVKKGENLIDYEEEIKAREKRTWFTTQQGKEKARIKGLEELNGPSKKTKGKLSGKEKKAKDDRRERGEGRMWKKRKGDARAVGKAGGSKAVKGARGGKKGGGVKAGKRRGR